MRRVDHKTMLDRWFVHDDPSNDPIYVECAVSNDAKKYYTAMLDIHPEEKPVPKGLLTLLRQLISWIPEPDGMDPFVLAHPDFDIQNFIVFKVTASLRQEMAARNYRIWQMPLREIFGAATVRCFGSAYEAVKFPHPP